jgi:hypothetical protein
MTTRHVSAQVPYPFEEPAAFGSRAILAGILDAYFFIQGDPTGVHGGDRAYPYVKLIDISPAGPDYRWSFEAVADGNLWEIWFDLPTSGGMGQVFNGDSTDCTCVLIFDTNLLYSGAGTAMDDFIEPSRTEWHTEKLEEICFQNIKRINGNENFGILIPVVSYAGGTIRMEDGYNTELSYDEDNENIVIVAGTELGRGRDPGFGDVEESVSSGSSAPSSSGGPSLQDYVSVVNGVRPQNGDIPVEVSPSLGIRRETGRLEIVVRR